MKGACWFVCKASRINPCVGIEGDVDESTVNCNMLVAGCGLCEP